MSSFKTDYSFGKNKEIETLDKINNFFNDNIKLITNTKSKYDYEGEKYIYELKARNNCYSKFPTTLIPYSKSQQDTTKKIRFLFSFTDGLYYITYRKKQFETFELNTFCRNKRVDYNDKPALYYYIPIDKLKKIDI